MSAAAVPPAGADDVYERALAAGGTGMEEPIDTPYGDRRAMARDPSGNVYQLAVRTTDRH